MPRARATLAGFGAVLLWSLLALLTVAAAPVPPFLLAALAFGLGAAVGGLGILLGGGAGPLRGLSWRVWAFGTAGLFGYHGLYFAALRLAPPAAAGLVAYLWPLLVVLFSGLLPGERLRAGHVAGGLAALAGVGLIALRGTGGAGAGALPGLALAFLAALTWALYSVVSRRHGAVPTAAVAVFCLASAILAGLAHLAFESPAWPVGVRGWAAVAALGLGPTGLAFYLWDIGVKRGNIQLLGVAAHAAPLLSTLALVAAGHVAATPTLALAAALIAGGALLAVAAGRRAAVSPG
ncbi:MAG: EamA family transporter [Rhodobacteraceae bacterium]|nr:EamA family transporter [Paracoccaceae bacterium]